MPNVAQNTAQDMEALDRGVIEAGLIAAEALAEVRALKEGLRRALAAAGLPPLAQPVPVPAVITRGHLSLLRS